MMVTMKCRSVIHPIHYTLLREINVTGKSERKIYFLLSKNFISFLNYYYHMVMSHFFFFFPNYSLI